MHSSKKKKKNCGRRSKQNLKEKILNYKNLKEKKYIALQIILQLFSYNCNVPVLWVVEKKLRGYV